MKKILFCSENKEWGGSEELWFRSATIALREGYFVGIYTHERMLPEYKLAELKKYPNLFVFHNKSAHLFIRIINRFLQLLFSKYTFYYFFDSFNQKAIDWQPDLVVFSHGGNLPIERAISKFQKKNIRYCIIAQAAAEQNSPEDRDVSFYKENFNHSQGNYFVSQANLELTKLQMGGSIPNAKVVRNPFNVSYHTDLSFPDNTVFKLACVARYDFKSKGQDVLLKVLSQEKWKNRNIEVNLYGSGENKNGIKKLIDFFELKNVFIKGHHATIDIWRENHALILPSRYEGLPLAIVEAMLCGRFAITTNVSGNTEVILDNKNGFIAEAPQVEYLDKAMERAWDRKEEWQNIGNEAKRYIKTLVPECPEKIFFEELISKI